MQDYYDSRFLARAKEMMVYDVGAQRTNVPQNEGKTVKWNRFTPLSKATSALSEATNPSFVDMTTNQVSATISPYGNTTKVGELFELTSLDTNLEEHVDVHGQNAGETLDELTKDTLVSGATTEFVNNVGATSSVASSDTLSGAEVRERRVQLMQNKARPFEDNLFRAIIPVSGSYDLRGDSEWLDARRYVDAEQILNGEVGRLHGFRFVETNNERVQSGAGSGSIDVYSTFFMGRNSYGIVNLEGQPEERMIVKQPGPEDTSNPLNMFSTVGWKAYYASTVLNSSWVIELEHSTGANI